MNSDEIRIVPQNPLDLRPEELEGLAEALRAKMPNLPVRIVAQPQHGYGVTFWEVLRVWVPWSDVAQDAAAAAVGIIAKELVSWARHRFKKSPGRPKYVAILGPNGEVLKVGPPGRARQDHRHDGRGPRNGRQAAATRLALSASPGRGQRLRDPARHHNPSDGNSRFKSSRPDHIQQMPSSFSTASSRTARPR